MSSASFRVKEEISRINSPRKCCRISELSALLHMDGSYMYRSSGRALITESNEVFTARKIHYLMRSLFNLSDTPVVVERESPKRRKVYVLEFSEQAGFFQALNELGILDVKLSPEPCIPERIVKRDCCVSAALRGAFLGAGYLSEPYKPADLEITFSSEYAADLFSGLFKRKGIKPGKRYRNGRWVLYLKSRSSISAYLAIIGAHRAHLEYESQIIMNSTRNAVNRRVNCDSANAKRIAVSSLKQRELIMRLKNAGEFPNLEPILVELAEARLENPQASLAELGKMMRPPITKSAVQRRMRKIMLICEERTY